MAGQSSGDEVLVTGAGSGIGEAVANRLLDAGWTVHATDIDESRVASLDSADWKAHRLDVTDDSTVERVLGEIDSLDCVVNNAGVAEIGPLEDVSVDAVRQQFDVNVHGPLRVCQAALPALRADGGGRIVNVSSVFGLVASPGTGAYSASKFALEGLTDALRRELDGQRVDVALVEPAWVRTEFADKIRARLANRDRTAEYERLYRLFEGTDILDGWSLAVDPSVVAGVVEEAVTAENPSPRYSVGSAARGFALAQYLPDRVLDALFGLLVEAAPVAD